MVAHLEDAAGVHVEGDLDLRAATWARGDARQLELAQQAVVFGQRTLALEHLKKKGRGEDQLPFPPNPRGSLPFQEF